MQRHETVLPALYSFRRCPYAMRARMAIRYSGIPVELREVVLKDKPSALLSASPKATVPVLVLDNNCVIDESLDIMYWALQKSDHDDWMNSSYYETGQQLIQYNDHVFKQQLDSYKYFERFPEYTQLEYRQQGEAFLTQLEQLLQNHAFLLRDQLSLADIAIFPFIRQFAYVDIDWFSQSPYPRLRNWLNYLLQSELFTSVMHKYPPWKEGSPAVVF